MPLIFVLPTSLSSLVERAATPKKMKNKIAIFKTRFPEQATNHTQLLST